MKIKHKESYRKLRAQNYPKLEDQLDMLWHGMDAGTCPKCEPFYSNIKKIKEAYPRCEEGM